VAVGSDVHVDGVAAVRVRLDAVRQIDRFTSTGGSSGLGLSIVRWVAQAHGGTLAAYNDDEGGVIFELRLPVLTS
jgi:signal transduction histidine kinase